ncbi:hypothetical protein TWF694_005624 [Orbilia ellipsospora]|uniref:Uncharacterized protein n=1 Tax=Orbilia ellipsospora TaxID=2528407 RepID=A0AAV9WUR2_9PEZI
MPSPENLSTPQRLLRTSQLNKMAALPDGRPIPPPPSFMPPPPPLGRKRQRGRNPAAKYQVTAATNDEDANYIVYPSSDEEEQANDTTNPHAERDGSDDDGTETPRNKRADSDGDFEMEESEVDFSEDQGPRRKRAKAGDDDDSSSEAPEDDVDTNDASSKPKSKRRISQKWREDVYRPSPGADSDDSDLNLTEITPEKRRGKRKSVGKMGSLNSRKPQGTNGLIRNKSKSTPNLRPDNQEMNKIRKSRFYEGSMNDRLTRKGGVPPFRNHQPSDDVDVDSGLEYNSFGVLQSSALTAMPPPPRPRIKGNSAPQSTPPPPKSKFTFFAPISNWFSKRWQKATQEYEERERRKVQEVEVQKHVRLIMERKEKAEKLYAENKLKGINQPTIVNQRVEQEPLVTEEQILQFMDPANEIGVAFTTDEVYAAPTMNESTMSVATIRPPAVLQGPTPRTSTDTTGSEGSSSYPGGSRSMQAPGGFTVWRDADPRDCTPLTTDTTDADIDGIRSRSRSPAPTPAKPLTKAEQKKKERLEKKLDDLRKKLAETEVDLSVVMGIEPLSTSTPAPQKMTAKKVASNDAEDTIVVHADGENEDGETEDEAIKIVESVMGEPEPAAAVAPRNRSMSPIKKIFPFVSKKTKDKDVANTTLHNVNESAKIKKPSPASVRGRASGRRRGGKGVSKSKRNASEDSN